MNTTTLHTGRQPDARENCGRYNSDRFLNEEKLPTLAVTIQVNLPGLTLEQAGHTVAKYASKPPVFAHYAGEHRRDEY